MRRPAPTGHCVSTANDEHCDNDAFCDGVESCDPSAPAADAGGCVLPGPSCTGARLPACAVPVCNEGPNSCGAVASSAFNCGDGNPCTTDACNPTANPLTNPTGCVHTTVARCMGCQSERTAPTSTAARSATARAITRARTTRPRASASKTPSVTTALHARSIARSMP